MKSLLFLAHRIPYPPNKGDKVRSYHLLEHLAHHYRIHLGTFIDDPRDWEHAAAVRELCADACFAPLPRTRAKALSLRALLTGEPLTLPYFRNTRLHRWVDELLASRCTERVLVFSSSMAQYMDGRLKPSMRSVIDFIDVDSHKWLQFAQNDSGLPRRIYRREAKELLRYERSIARRFDASVFVSAKEAALFRRLAPECADRVSHVDNGVDVGYFSPDAQHANPYTEGDKALVFTGAMDYRANVDAVGWFAHDVLPLIRVHEPRACLYIVGSRPGRAVRGLAGIPGVRLAADVPDVRPYIAHAVAAVAPLRMARGVQNKVLEAMAMGKTVLATPAALEGIDAGAETGVRLASAPRSFADEALALLSRRCPPCATEAARRYVVENHDWGRNLEGFVRLLEGLPVKGEIDVPREHLTA
ncbi:MAG: TIGR03087 family PEP-CTERM/XrtA system glycosyltransferase [Gammaproteobacteria bacterium]|nr:TIGR03087 family PEP-CTERM/XrtA system glycosyltransferase [Gammaproteobacteria bacterium]NIR84452.1 TIGR03087 family PEP-CTERM/XrtA system glycosyltransferase [Gammaproteobacteria bacterium]NIR90933.1 TIGR03087 family PEP-CTERM/XrtA system glycosyltransferase [Gammaproteobacteria bacterium]NIU07119.1 TIGR03087 family PEP-CTERM/XrtA system glycosyltransferase [Gammaproteobacteria bacterium]NIV76248.1 TIGR03087 family PEP-CTERM/XrtA system glycosyltransferase [Gammaproteobacteria bacterium]